MMEKILVRVSSKRITPKDIIKTVIKRKAKNVSLKIYNVQRDEAIYLYIGLINS
jgi:hypothetical protein